MFQSAHPGPAVILNGELSASGPDPVIPEIEYAPAVMESIRAEAVDGLMKLGRGGIECGGVLYGRITDKLIRILAARPLECEHRLGPSFVLSEKDEARLREMIEPAGRDDETRDLDVVGWYMSHCRRGLPLAETDVRLFNQYFDKPGNVTAIVMPQKLGSATVGFFIRGRNGELRPDVPSVQESLAGPADLVLAAAPQQPHATGPTALVPSARSIAAVNGSVIGSVTGDRDAAASKLQLYLQQQEKHRRVSTWNLVITMAVLVVLAVGGLYLWMRPGVPDTPAAIPLRVSDSGAQIRVEWDSKLPSVQTAVSGLLEMREADGATVRLTLPPDMLRTGSAIYTRHTDKLEIRLKLLYAKAPAFDSVVYFINPLTSAAQQAQASKPQQPAVVSKVEPPVIKAPDPAPQKARTFEPPHVTPNTATTTANTASTPLPTGNISVPTQAPTVSLPFSAGPAIAPPPPVAAPPPAPVAKTNPEPAARPRSGRLIWTGDLARNALLSITATGASPGWINGRLPGVPIKVSVYPGELVPGGIQVYGADPKQPTTTESPSAQNGWNTVVHRYDAKHISDIRIVAAPSAENSWSQLVVQNGKRPVSVLVITWSSVPAQ